MTRWNTFGLIYLNSQQIRTMTYFGYSTALVAINKIAWIHLFSGNSTNGKWVVDSSRTPIYLLLESLLWLRSWLNTLKSATTLEHCLSRKQQMLRLHSFIWDAVVSIKTWATFLTFARTGVARISKHNCKYFVESDLSLYSFWCMNQLEILWFIKENDIEKWLKLLRQPTPNMWITMTSNSLILTCLKSD